MKKIIWLLLVFAVLLILGTIYLATDNQQATQDKSNLIVVDTPTPGAVVNSPLNIKGRARGYWYFEASFPIRLLDADGNLLTIKPAQAEGEWMTEEFVPFSLNLEFEPPKTDTGTLILEKDNPSGLPEYADELRIPIRFR